MNDTLVLPADDVAERIVRHFQAEGFAGITEALIVRIRLIKGDRQEVEAAFDRSVDLDVTPPVREFFEIRPYGHFSEERDFSAVQAAFAGDFGVGLRRDLPAIYFDDAPVVVDDALATGTKYDAMLKLRDNAGGYAMAILLNDPNSSFFEYLGTHRAYDWQQIMGDFGAAATAFALDADLL